MAASSRTLRSPDGAWISGASAGRGHDVQPQVFRILFDDANEVQLQRCPASLAPGSCEVPMIRFDPENMPAESASPS